MFPLFYDEVAFDTAPLKLRGPSRTDDFKSLRGLVRIEKNMAYPVKEGEDLILSGGGTFGIRVSKEFRFAERLAAKREEMLRKGIPFGGALLLGDSFFELWEQNFPESYEKLLPGIKKVNAAMSATTTQDQRQCLKTLAKGISPDYVFVNIGINNMDDTQESGDKAYLAWRSYMLDLIERFKDSHIFVNNIPFCTGKFKDRAGQYEIFNRLAETFALGTDSVTLVDINSAFGEDDAEYQCDDGLHPNEKGYQIMADRMQDALNGWLETKDDKTRTKN